METSLEQVRNDAFTLPDDAQESLFYDLGQKLANEAGEVIDSMSAERRKKLETTLLERDKGPFVNVEDTEAWLASVKNRALARLAKERGHA